MCTKSKNYTYVNVGHPSAGEIFDYFFRLHGRVRQSLVSFQGDWKGCFLLIILFLSYIVQQ